MFSTTANKGFKITFKNNITLSVQFGASNYCERRNINQSCYYEMDLKNLIIESNNAEIAISDENDNFITREFFKEYFNEELYDAVKGFVDADEVADVIYYAKNMK